jgi:hypothetical protein
MLINAHTDAVGYALPEMDSPGRWETVLNTDQEAPPLPPNEPNIELCARSLMLLQWVVEEGH